MVLKLRSRKSPLGDISLRNALGGHTAETWHLLKDFDSVSRKMKRRHSGTISRHSTGVGRHMSDRFNSQ